MKQQKHRKQLEGVDLLEAMLEAFPRHLYPEMRANQREAFELIAKNDGRVTLEPPTGAGKTVIGYTFLKALAGFDQWPLFYVVPTKTLVEQVKRLHPDLATAYGRHEFDCLYYPGEGLKADEIPCLILRDCKHRVDQNTGATLEPGVTGCPYYQQKFEAKHSQIVVCTMAFYLFHQLFTSSAWDEPAGLVIDEAHDIAKVVRNALSYEITDYHLGRACELLEDIDQEAAATFKDFRRKMIRIIKRKPAARPMLLEDHEIRDLIDVLEQVDAGELEKELSRAVAKREIDPVAQRATLKQLEVLIRDLRRYIRSFEFSLPEGKRHALNYTYAYYEEERGEHERAQYRLVVKAHYVAPLIAKILAPRTVAYSATIGDPRVFGYETGIRAPVYSLGSDFPVGNTRVFLPTDTPNLAVKERIRQEPTRVLRRTAKACVRFARAGHRSLVVVIAERERQKFLQLAAEEGLKTLSYGDRTPAKEVAARFRNGEGDALVGTAAQYGEGIDLPKQVAPVIFMLRPGYPRPDDPATIFEERRFSGGQVWAIRNWRVMMEALQVRGRNVRSASDIGVTFFISQQFRRFVSGVLPAWLRDAYRGTSTFEECVEETLKLLGSG